MTNRLKGLDLIDRVPDELWTEVHDIVQKAGIKTISKKKKCKKAKWLSEEALQVAGKRRKVKGKGEKERYNYLNAEFQIIARKDKKAFLRDQCKEWERLEISSRKLEIPREYLMQKWAQLKDSYGIDLIEAEDIKKRWQEYTEKPIQKKIFITQITTMV